MTAFVALLRGINVGRAKRVPMAKLRAMFERLGYTDVATLLNSGNVVFSASGGSAAKHGAAIAAAIKKTFKFDVAVVVTSARALEAIATANRLAKREAVASRVLVAFPRPGGLASLRRITALLRPKERFAIGKHAAYMYLPAGIAKSKAGAALLATPEVTTRNWATVLKLVDLAGGRSTRK
jgi:uncharacterized protein (DUF1697 family)